MLRKIGDKVVLTAKAAKPRPDLKGVVGLITYHPLSAKGLREKKFHTHYNVNFGDGKRYIVAATDIRKAKK